MDKSYFKDTVLANQQIVVVDSLWFASGFVNLSKEEDYVYLLDEKGHLIDAINYKGGRSHPFIFRRIVEEGVISGNMVYVSGKGSPEEVNDPCIKEWLDSAKQINRTQDLLIGFC